MINKTYVRSFNEPHTMYYDDTFVPHKATIDYYGESIGVTFGEAQELPAGFFDSGIEKFLPEQQQPAQYEPVDTAGAFVEMPTPCQVFWSKVGSGIYNTVKGAVNIGKELGCMYVDWEFGKITILTTIAGHPIVFDPWSNALKALDSGNISTGEYYYDALMNIASFGVYSQENAFYAWWNGQITDDEMQQIIGGTAVWQGIPGALKYGPKMIPARVAPKTTALREGGCFTEGTQIVVCMDQVEDESGNLTTVYTTINIEDVKVGDWVYSYNTLTGETELCEVAETFSLTSSHINLLTFTDEYGHEQTLESTDAHPFWVVTDDPDLSRAARSVVDENSITLYHGNLETGLNGYWVEAKDLRIGDVFLGANGELSTLINAVRVEQSDGIAVLYPFTGIEFHRDRMITSF